MAEVITFLVKEIGSVGKDIFLVIFTYIFATRQAVKNKKNEIRLDNESDEESRIEEFHRQFPIVINEMKNNSRLLGVVANTLEGLSDDSKITRKRLDHLAEVDDEMRRSYNEKFSHLEESIDDIKGSVDGKFNNLNKQVQAVSRITGELQHRMPKKKSPKPLCPKSHFEPPLYDGPDASELEEKPIQGEDLGGDGS